MDDPPTPPAATTPDKKKPRRRRGDRASEEAVLTLTVPIANWQARLGWQAAMWGLIPVAGLALGIIAVALGALGYRRVRRRPDDLGIRHAVGALILGSIEILVNLAGLGCIGYGLSRLE